MSVNESGASTRIPDVANPATASGNAPIKSPGITPPAATNVAPVTPAATPGETLSDEGRIVQQSIERSLLVGTQGQSLELDEATRTSINAAGTLQPLLDETVVSGDVRAIEKVLRDGSTVELAQLSDALRAVVTTLTEQQELAGQVVAFVSSTSSEPAGNEELKSLKGSIERLLGQIDALPAEGGEQFLSALEATANLVRASATVLQEVLPERALSQLQNGIEMLEEKSGEFKRVPGAPDLEKVKAHLRSVLTTLESEQSGRTTALSDQLRDAIPELQNIAGKTPVLAQVTDRVQSFMKRVQQFDAIALAQEKIAQLLDQKDALATPRSQQLMVLLKQLDNGLETLLEKKGAPPDAIRQLATTIATLQAFSEDHGAALPRESRVAVREIAAHVQNVILEQQAKQEIEYTVSAMIRDDTRSSSIEIGRALERILADVPSIAQASVSFNAEELVRFIEGHVSTPVNNSEVLQQRLETISHADSLEQVRNTLLALKESVRSGTTRAEAHTLAFSEYALAQIDSLPRTDSIERSLQAQLALTQVKQELDTLLSTLVPESGVSPAAQSEALGDVLSQRQRTLLRSLEGSLEAAIQEFSHEINEAGKLPGELLLSLREQFSLLLKENTNSATSARKAFNGNLQQWAMQLSASTVADSTPEQVLQSLLTIRNEVQELLRTSTSSGAGRQLEQLGEQLQRILQDPVSKQQTGGGSETTAGAKIIEKVIEEIQRQGKEVPEQLQQMLSMAARSPGSNISAGTGAVGALLQSLKQQVEAGATEGEGVAFLAREIADHLTPFSSATNEVAGSPALQALESLLKAKSAIGGSPDQIAAEFQNLLDIVAAIKTRGAAEESPFERSLSAVVQQMSAALEQALNGDAKQKHDVLVQFSDLMRREVLKHLSGGKGSDRDKTLKALKDLETLVKGQEALLTMAPLIDAAGDPIFVLFPMLLDGFLSKVELTYFGAQDEVDTEEQQKKRGKKGFATSSMTITLPSLGPVAVHFSHRDREILCELQFERQAVATFIEQRIPKLEAAFARAGFEDFTCSVAVGPVMSVAPGWSQKFIRSAVVA